VARPAEKDPAIASGQLTVEELIRSQLQGKLRAIERYDQIILLYVTTPLTIAIFRAHAGQ
jgi:hypothetical protein